MQVSSYCLLTLHGSGCPLNPSLETEERIPVRGQGTTGTTSQQAGIKSPAARQGESERPRSDPEMTRGYTRLPEGTSSVPYLPACSPVSPFCTVGLKSKDSNCILKNKQLLCFGCARPSPQERGHRCPAYRSLIRQVKIPIVF